jgi:hypothetical protein
VTKISPQDSKLVTTDRKFSCCASSTGPSVAERYPEDMRFRESMAYTYFRIILESCKFQIIFHYKDSLSAQRRATCWTTGVGSPAGTRGSSLFHSAQTGSGTNQSSYSLGSRGRLPRRYNGRGMKLTTNFRLVPKSRKRRTIRPLSHTSSWRCALFWDLAATTCPRWFLARGYFYSEDGGYKFLRIVGLYMIHTAPHPRRRHSS